MTRSCILATLLAVASLAFASTPVVTVSSPKNGTSVGSPINYIASASTTCAQGISTMRIYTASGVVAYSIHASHLNTNINLAKGTYSTVVQAWDHCGGVGKTTVKVTVSSIALAPPKFLYATEYAAGRIAEYKVNALTGSLTATSQGSAAAHFGPVDIASDHWGTHLYVANQGSHDVSAYVINRSSGNLSQVAGSPFALVGTGARVAVTPTNKFVYVTSTTNKGGSRGINAFAVQSDGSLKPVPGTPFDTAALGAIAITPNGKYLYAAEIPQGNVGAFVINQTSGALTPVAGSPFAVPRPACSDCFVESPSDLGVDASGTFLYGTLASNSAVAGFHINGTTGSLSNISGSPWAQGQFNSINGNPQDPMRLSVDPSDRFVYTADDESNAYGVFKLNRSSGVLTFVDLIGNQSNAFLQGLCVPYTVNVDPSGTFVYSEGITSNLCAPGGNAMIGFSMNQFNGNLLSVPGSPFPNANVHTSTTSEEKVLVTR